MKRIAIVGAGFAGLALAWQLQGSAEVVLFDAGGGASRIATGLLHPFAGRRALRSWRATEGMAATRELLSIAAESLGREVKEESGLLRLALLEGQKSDFAKRAKKDPEAIWWEEEKVAAYLPLAIRVPGLWIPSGVAVYSESYLEGLWKACAQKGAIRIHRKIQTLQELQEFDRIVLATGSDTLHFPECASLPLERLKGQTLVCRWPKKLPCSLLGNGHITPTEDSSLCQIGSTYERGFKDDQPDPAKATELLSTAATFYPPAGKFEIVEIRAGIRMAWQERGLYRPLVRQITDKAWVFTALGSRGLLYHALLAKELSHEL